ARELAEMKLDILPTLRGDISRKATKENWKWQPRQGAGGGREFSFRDMPPAIQQAIILHHADNNTLLSAPSPIVSEQSTSTRIVAKDRAAAKAVIIAAFDKARAASGAALKQAEADFVHLYQTEASCGGGLTLPAWVFDIY